MFGYTTFSGIVDLPFPRTDDSGLSEMVPHAIYKGVTFRSPRGFGGETRTFDEARLCITTGIVRFFHEGKYVPAVIALGIVSQAG